MKFNECFEVKIIKAYKKLIRRQTEEGTFMVIVKGKLLNSKTEWHQPKIVRTAIHSDGAELAGGRIVSFPVDGSQRTQENCPSHIHPLGAEDRALPASQSGRLHPPGMEDRALPASSL